MKKIALIASLLLFLLIVVPYNQPVQGGELLTRTIYLIGDSSLIVGQNRIVAGDGSQQNPFLIKDLTITPLSTHNGIVIINISKFVKLSNIMITGGINGITIENSKNITVEKVTILNTSASGIVLLGASNIKIDNATIKDIPYRGIYTNTNHFPEKTFGNSITRSTIDNTGDSSILMFGNNTIISNNQVLNSKFRSIVVLSPFVNSVIADNYIENSQLEAIFAVGYQNLSILPTIGKSADKSTKLYIVNNEIKNMHEDGIELLEGVSNSVVTHNFIHDSPLANSINFGHMNSLELFRNANNIELRHNIIANTGGDPAKYANGITIAQSPSNVVDSNSITNVPGFGVMIVWDDANWPIPQGNKITGNVVFNAKQLSVLNHVDSQDLVALNTIIFD
ncbi:MAG: right-handed parallel beta-helix repeat-containing protein [Nitrososphaerales archaeon]